MSFDAASSMLLDHARSGIVETVARLVQFAADDTQDRHYQIVTRRHWAEVRDDDISNSYFWESGSIKEPSESTRFQRSLGIEGDDDPPAIVTLGVRFEPAGIEALRPKASAPLMGNTNPMPTPPPLRPEREREESHAAKEPNDAPKPPLSGTHLQAWWTFYKAVTPPNEETELRAIDHVQRCFPNHNVARPRIRTLRGKASAPGPKPKPAE